MLTLEGCRTRLQRLRRSMANEAIDLVFLGNPKTIYYFTGTLVDDDRPQAFAVKRDGGDLLVTNREPERSVAEAVRVYTSYTLERAFLRSTMNGEAMEAVERIASANAGAVAVEYEYLNAGLAAAIGRPARNITPLLDQMRRRKDPDELDCLRETIRLTEAGYAALKREIAHGMTELDAHSLMYRAMVDAAGTSLPLRGDFACGTRAINGGGPPTARQLEPGDLYILDIFPTWRGYTCDLCRTFSVGPPTEAQAAAWERVMDAHRLAQALIRPGVRCRDVYASVRALLDASFNHHLGHGVGMDAWEYPWLNAGTDQVFEEGEVVAVEPGLYSPEMRGGIRLEHNYLIGRDSLIPLDTFPMELH